MKYNLAKKSIIFHAKPNFVPKRKLNAPYKSHFSANSVFAVEVPFFSSLFIAHLVSLAKFSVVFIPELGNRITSVIQFELMQSTSHLQLRQSPPQYESQQWNDSSSIIMRWIWFLCAVHTFLLFFLFFLPFCFLFLAAVSSIWDMENSCAEVMTASSLASSLPMHNSPIF